MIDNIHTLLDKAGVNKSETAVYMAGKKIGTSTSAQLIKVTGLPRPTVMAALASLREFGLCVAYRRDGRSFSYTMQPMVALNKYIGTNIRQANDLIEEINLVDESSVYLETYRASGQIEVQNLIEQALRCKTRKWQIIAPKDNALAHMPASYTKYFKEVRRERQIESETLWSEMDKRDNIPLHDVIMRKPRYVPKDISKQIPSLLLAFDDKLLAIDGTTNPSAVLVTNTSIVQTFKVVFELAWRSCR